MEASKLNHGPRVSRRDVVEEWQRDILEILLKATRFKGLSSFHWCVGLMGREVVGPI